MKLALSSAIQYNLALATIKRTQNRRDGYWRRSHRSMPAAPGNLQIVPTALFLLVTSLCGLQDRRMNNLGFDNLVQAATDLQRFDCQAVPDPVDLDQFSRMRNGWLAVGGDTYMYWLS